MKRRVIITRRPYGTVVESAPGTATIAGMDPLYMSADDERDVPLDTPIDVTIEVTDKGYRMKLVRDPLDAAQHHGREVIENLDTGFRNG